MSQANSSSAELPSLIARRYQSDPNTADGAAILAGGSEDARSADRSNGRYEVQTSARELLEMAPVMQMGALPSTTFA